MKKKEKKSEKEMPQQEGSCGGKGKKYREMMKIKECFCSQFDPVNIVNSLAFNSKKPFKVSFNEGLSVKWNNTLISEEDNKNPFDKKSEPKKKKDPQKESSKEKKLTPRDKKQKKEFVEKMKGKMGGMRKKYGKKAEGVMHAIATKEAKKKP